MKKVTTRFADVVFVADRFEARRYRRQDSVHIDLALAHLSLSDERRTPKRLTRYSRVSHGATSSCPRKTCELNGIENEGRGSVHEAYNGCGRRGNVHGRSMVGYQ